MLLCIGLLSVVLGLIGGPLTLIGPIHNEGHNLHHRRPGVVESGATVAAIAAAVVVLSRRRSAHH
jgi:hypothetical protein